MIIKICFRISHHEETGFFKWQERHDGPLRAKEDRSHLESEVVPANVHERVLTAGDYSIQPTKQNTKHQRVCQAEKTAVGPHFIQHGKKGAYTKGPVETVERTAEK